MNKVQIVLCSLLINFILPGATALFSQQEVLLNNSSSDAKEKIVLYLSRNILIAGEELHFSTYILSDNFLSKVLYVEIFNSKKRTISKGKFKIVENRSDGVLHIDGTTPTDRYFVRAYTQYSRNFSINSLTTSIITVINPDKPVKSLKKEIDTLIYFYPQGGEIVSGESNKLAYKINSRIRTDDIQEIFLADDQNLVRKKIEYFDNGYGFIDFTFVDSLKYYFYMKLKTENDSFRVELPSVHLKTDITIHTIQRKFALEIEVASLYEEPHKYILSIFSQDNQLLYKRDLRLKRGSFIFEFDNNKLATGINKIILFEENNHIKQVKTILFIPKNPENLEIVTSKPIYKPREQVEFKINPDNNLERNSDITISVIKTGTFYTKSEIVPAFILNNPSFLPDFLTYHSPPDSFIRDQIDIAMILYEDRIRKTGKLELNDSISKKIWLPEPRGISLEGRLINTVNNKPLGGSDIYLSTIGSEPQIHIYETNKDGSFAFSLNHLTGTQQLYLCSDVKNTSYKILINNDYITKYPKYIDYDLPIYQYNPKTIEELFINAQLTDNSVSTVELNDSNIVNPNILYTHANTIIELDDYISLPTMQEVFTELIPVVKFRKVRSKYEFLVLDDIWRHTTYTDPLVLLDNIPVFNNSLIANLPPSDIKKIEVINRIYQIGDYSINGIIAIHTRKADFGNVKLPDESVFVEYDTFSPDYKLNVSDYGDSKKKESKIPDFRNLLYWKPHMHISDSTEKLSFFASDHCSDYDIIIQGITDNGEVIFGKTTFSVRK